ncbi:MAG: hypothetical protein ACJ762_01555 [Solirubrobacteraceae bacterium]
MVRKLVLAAAALTLALAPGALADGDPASDVLPSQDAFYPYTPPASKPLVTALDALLKQVREGGYPMKVALIESAADLGSYPTMFNNPQQYTDLLASELPTNPHGKSVVDELHLLVVMPGGFGGKNLGDKVDEALDGVNIDVDAQTDGLVRAALKGVARIASANGVKTAVPSEAEPGGDGGGSKTVLLIVIGGVIVLLVIALIVVRRRARPSDERPDEEPAAQEDGHDARST